MENYTNMMVYANKWESQRYEDRKQYMAKLLQTYTELVLISEMGIAVENETNPQAAKADFASLHQSIQAVQSAYDTYQVVERPNNERYYQVPGHECLLAGIADSRQVTGNMPDGWSGTPDDFRDQLQNHQFKNLFTNQSLGVSNSNPTAQWLHQVYLDYGGKALSDIFFDPTERNITRSGSLDGANFITNDEKLDWDPQNCYGLIGPYTEYDFFESATIASNDSSTNVMQLAQGCFRTPNPLPGTRPWVYLDDQPNVNFIGLAVLNQGKTPTDFTPSSIGKSTPPTSSTANTPSSTNSSTSTENTPSSANSSTSSAGSPASAAVDNPYTGANMANTSLPWALAVALAGGVLSVSLLRKRRSHH